MNFTSPLSFDQGLPRRTAKTPGYKAQRQAVRFPVVGVQVVHKGFPRQPILQKKDAAYRQSRTGGILAQHGSTWHAGTVNRFLQAVSAIADGG